MQRRGACERLRRQNPGARLRVLNARRLPQKTPEPKPSGCGFKLLWNGKAARRRSPKPNARPMLPKLPRKLKELPEQKLTEQLARRPRRGDGGKRLNQRLDAANSYGNVAVEVGRVEVWQVEVGFGRPRPILRKHARVFSLGWFGYGVKRRCSAREAVEGGRSWAEDSAIGVRDLVFARVCVCWMLHPLVGAEP